MKERKGMVPLLILIALAVWGSNLYRLIQPGDGGEITLSEIPEVPVHLTEEALEYELPELKLDPFNPNAAPVQPTTRRQNRPRPEPPKPRINPPRAQLQMIHEREGELIALFQEQGQSDSKVFKKGETLEDWTIEKIEFDGVFLKNKEGQEHVLRIGL